MDKKMEVSGVGQIIPWDDGVMMRHYSYLSPNSWLLFDGAKTSRHPLSNTSGVNFDGYKVIREFATSLDGTRVPVNIILGKDAKLNGKNPLLLSLTTYLGRGTLVTAEQHTRGGCVALVGRRRAQEHVRRGGCGRPW